MSMLIDKLILFVISLALYMYSVNGSYVIVPVLIVMIFSAVLSYLDHDRIKIGVFACYMVVCFVNPGFLFFIPLICYDIMMLPMRWIWLFSLLPIAAEITKNGTVLQILIFTMLAVAYILKYRTVTVVKLRNDYYELQYNAKEISLQLEEKNKSLMEKQDYEVNLATLNERNRIARDIHDNVGHMLSRSILQVGALLAICKDDMIKENLNLIKDTLSEAMNSIRNSVHDLHEESVDLYTEIQKLISNFQFCQIKLEYEVDTNPEKNIKYCFLMVTKEALSNIIKHSNATNVSVYIREHPALYQLVITDNGTQLPCRNEKAGEMTGNEVIRKETSRTSVTELPGKSGNGIGLKNITERVTALNGNVNISYKKGFRIFISIPKK